MKKQLSLMLIFLLLFSLVGALPAQAKVYEEYPYLYADFETEDSINDFSLFNENTAVWTKGGAGESSGCVKAVQTKDYGGLIFTIPNGDDFIGRTFKLSVWVKLDTAVCTLKEAHDQVKFVFQGPTKTGSEVVRGYKILGVSQLGLNGGNWVYAETVVKNWDGKMDNGTIVPNYDEIGYTVMLRIGNANGQEVTNALATGSKIAYYLDDFIAEPVADQYVPEGSAAEETKIVEKLDFSVDAPLTGAPYKITSNYNKDAVRSAEAGCDGKPGYLAWAMAAPNTSNADVWFNSRLFQYNKLYKISLFAKADNTFTAGKTMQLIVARGSRLDNTNDTGMYQNDSYQNLIVTKSLTEEWTRYEIYMMRHVKSFDEKPLNMILRVSGTPADVAYSVDDFTIEEYGTPVNGDFEWKKGDIPKTPVTGHTDDSADYGTFYGWFEKGVAVEAAPAAAGSAGTYSAKITTTEQDGSMYQGVYFENNKEQPLTFKAKGEGASVGKSIQIKLDRHVDTVDSDDVYTVPDTELLGEDLILTSEWKEYTIPYIAAFSAPSDAKNVGPRQPFLSFVVDGGSSGMTFYVDDLSLTAEREKYALPYVTDLALDTINIEGSTAHISYSYQSEMNQAEAGTVLRVLKKTENGRFVALAQMTGENGIFEYTIPETEIGAELRYEIFPIAMRGGKRTGGAVYSIDAPEAVKQQLIVTSELGAFNPESNSITGKLYVENNRVDGTSVQVFLGIVLYDAEDEIIRIACRPVQVENMESVNEVLSVSTADNSEQSAIAKAKAFVWGGTDMVNTDMHSYAPMIEVRK